ncbi:MAG: hypothetical protein RLZZ502_921 [Pseudomonadota bacterium]
MTTPGNNYSVAAFTNGADPSTGIMLRTLTNITLASSNRFITGAIDVAVKNCQANHPLLTFSLVDAVNVETPLGGSAIDVCLSGGAVTAPALGAAGAITQNATVGRYTSPGAILYGGATVGYVVRNTQASGTGNDAAFDNVQLLDVTPTLDKAFSVSPISVNGTSALVFTITNTSELNAKNGWTFIDTLPAGLTIASPNGLVNGCGTTAVSAPAGGNTITVTAGNLSSGTAACNIQVNVTAGAVGSYTNGPGNISSLVGLNPPQNATLVVAMSDMIPSLSGMPTSAEVGVPYSGSFTCTNTAPAAGAATAAASVGTTCAISGLPVGVSVTSCSPTVPTTGTVAIGAAITCTVGGTPTTAGTSNLTLTTGAVNDVNGGTTSGGNNSVTGTISTIAPDVITSVTLSPGAVTQGSPVTATVQVSNIGAGVALNTTVTLQLPVGLLGVTASNGGVYNPANGLVTWPVVANIPANTLAAQTYTVVFTPAGTGAVNVQSSASVPGGETSTANNPGNAALSVAALAVPTLHPLSLFVLAGLLFAFFSRRRQQK